MSATATRLPLREAQVQATALVRLLRDACVRIEVAGSVRRRRPDVGDLEIVAIAATAPAQTTLWGEQVGERDLLEERLLGLLALTDGLVRRRETNGRPAWGPRYKRLWYRDTPVDLFVARPETFGLAMAVRTGPAEFSHQLVTPSFTRTRTGRPGLLPPYLRVQDGLRYRTSGELLPTPEEVDVWRALQLRWRDPEDRR